MTPEALPPQQDPSHSEEHPHILHQGESMEKHAMELIGIGYAAIHKFDHVLKKHSKHIGTIAKVTSYGIALAIAAYEIRQSLHHNQDADSPEIIEHLQVDDFAAAEAANKLSKRNGHPKRTNNSAGRGDIH